MGSRKNVEVEDVIGSIFEDKTKMPTFKYIPTEDPKIAKEKSRKNIPPELEKVAEKFKAYLKSKEVRRKKKFFCFNTY